MTKKIVMGIGNILLRDEGFGVKVIEYLRRQVAVPSDVELMDGGTLGLDLVPYLAEAERLIILDCVQGGKEPGTFYDFRGEAVTEYFQQAVSLHDIGIQEVLAVLKVIGAPLNQVIVLGVQPESLDLGLELSEVVAKQVRPTAETVAEILTSWESEVN